MSETQLTFGRTDDYIFISKPKKGIAYVEARFKDDKGLAHTDKGCQLLLSKLEREWSAPKLKDDTVISLEADLLKEPVFHKEIPSDMFHSLRVVEFQGLDPSTRVVSIRDVAIKVNLYGCTPESPSESDDELVDILPSATKVDGIWELLVTDHDTTFQIMRWGLDCLIYFHSLGLGTLVDLSRRRLAPPCCSLGDLRGPEERSAENAEHLIISHQYR
ncbi:thyroid receptor-interacting protein 13 [Colletotrichum acutatum]